MAKRKPKGVAKLKKELWKLFALYIKLKHSEDGVWCQCYTCSKAIQIGTTNCQAGHWMSKAAFSVFYFDERAVRPQCMTCNCHYGGNNVVFDRRLRQEIGDETVEDMYWIRHSKVKRTVTWYEEQIEHYKSEVKRIQEGIMCA